MSRPRLVPDTPERVLGLIRVSKERDGMVSPAVQRAAIEDHATRHGQEVAGWLEGIDESGSRARSAWWPRLDQAVQAVEDGQYDVIVVWKWSRVARQRLRWATALDRVETAGGRIESATEGVDVTTSAGRLTRGMLGELNAFQAELIGDTWREVHDHRIRSGRPATGRDKYGYSYDRDQKVHVPDPDTGPLLADLYRRYTTGESVFSLVRWLNTRGHRTVTGGPWSDRTLRRVFDSGFAAGLFAAHGQLHPGVHDPLITAGEWQAYQDARDSRRVVRHAERSAYLLSGLVVCARCQATMVADSGPGRGPRYRCRTRKTTGGCEGGYVSAALVETAVEDWLRGIATEADPAHRAALAARAHRSTARADAARLARQVARATDALTRLATSHAEHPLPAAVYRASYTDLAGTLDRLTAELEQAQREGRTAPTSPRVAARSLLASWDTTPVDVRRAALAELVTVWVTTGRPRAVLDIRPRWRTTDQSRS